MDSLPSIAGELQARFAQVKLFLCDVDGVLTDAAVFLGIEGEFKRFNIQDGLGMVTLRENGIRVGWISSRPSPATLARATQLKIDFLHQAKGSKVAAVEKILAETGCKWEEVCFVGDDIVDLGAIARAGIGVAVANAVAEAKASARYITQAAGGYGAVREVIELILKAQGKWEGVIAFHTAEEGR
jgi:3-deoxy-D-manno-octulosonate 8-phosphate phosphatase (KDO 8-P phosphatase)